MTGLTGLRTHGPDWPLGITDLCWPCVIWMVFFILVVIILVVIVLVSNFFQTLNVGFAGM